MRVIFTRGRNIKHILYWKKSAFTNLQNVSRQMGKNIYFKFDLVSAGFERGIFFLG